MVVEARKSRLGRGLGAQLEEGHIKYGIYTQGFSGACCLLLFIPSMIFKSPGVGSSVDGFIICKFLKESETFCSTGKGGMNRWFWPLWTLKLP